MPNLALKSIEGRARISAEGYRGQIEYHTVKLHFGWTVIEALHAMLERLLISKVHLEHTCFSNALISQQL
jgi:hypothetical protein